MSASAFAAVSDVFVSPRAPDAFPMALCEAMASGAPAVSFHRPSGPRDRSCAMASTARSCPRGDVPASAAAIDRVLTDPDLASRLSARAVEITGRFGMAAVLERPDAVFADLPSSSVRSRETATLFLRRAASSNRSGMRLNAGDTSTRVAPRARSPSRAPRSRRSARSRTRAARFPPPPGSRSTPHGPRRTGRPARDGGPPRCRRKVPPGPAPPASRRTSAGERRPSPLSSGSPC